MANTKKALPSAQKSAIVKLWKKGVPLARIGEVLRISVSSVRRQILVHRAENGDLQAAESFEKLRACQRRSTAKYRDRVVGGNFIEEVEPYQCPTCRGTVIFKPCLICLIREKNKRENFKIPPVREKEANLDLDLDHKMDKRRRKILSHNFRVKLVV